MTESLTPEKKSRARQRKKERVREREYGNERERVRESAEEEKALETRHLHTKLKHQPSKKIKATILIFR